MIKRFQLGACEYGIIEGATQSIILETDCCHIVEDNDAMTEMADSYGFQPTYANVAVKDLIAQAEPIDDLTKWIHYFGIKPRVGSNYRELLRSMKEIGADAATMPEWKRRMTA